MARLTKIDAMHYRFGEDTEHRCKDCSNFTRYRYHDYMYSKCAVYGDSRSSATDWNGRNTACGKFNMPYKGVPVKENLPGVHSKEDGEITLF